MSTFDEPRNSALTGTSLSPADSFQSGARGKKDTGALRSIFFIVRRQFATAIITFLVVFALFAIYTLTRQPLYDSLTVIDLNPNGRGGSLVGDTQQQNLGYEEAKSRVATQIEILRGDTIALDTCDHLGLLRSAAFLSTLKEPVSGNCNSLTPRGRSVVLNAMRKMIHVDSVAGTNLVHIEATTPNPILSMQIANGLVDSFIGSNLNANDTVPRQVSGWLNNQMQTLPPQAAAALRQSFIDETLRSVEIRVLEVAAIADEPTYPRRPRMLFFAFLVALSAASILAYVLDDLRGSLPAISSNETRRNS
jgi:uncharacterized protein involved in exopolysaccharide biosynthesis